MTHLFLFTIGPVQSFIAQARKTKDLYAGSQILSQLCAKAIQKAEDLGAEIIFPFLDKKQENPSLPNRFIAKLPKHPDLSFQEIGKAVEDKVRFDFKAQAEKLLTEIKIKDPQNKPSGFDQKFRAQIEGHLDIHWVIVPIKENESYQHAFERTERILGSVKNLRDFTQNPEQGRKCSLDGQNNALFFTTLFRKPSFADNAVQIYSGNLAKGEGLSAVSLLKRNFKSNRFSSTAKIALMHNEDTLSPKAKASFENYKNLFTEKSEKEWLDSFDHQLLFRENISNKTIPNDEQRKRALKLFEEIETNFKDKYYALIHFDGDHMGKLISGGILKNDSDKSDDKLPAFQKYISQLLAEFAQWASEICLVEPRGQTVYAGGDDFLGFINLTHLFDVMQELREGFESQVNKRLKAEYELNDDFTFSAGVVVAHYKDPLSLVLEQARKAEKIAKEEGDRNAFCLVASKGSGETHQTCFKWDHGYKPTLSIAKKLVEWLFEDKISKKFIVNFATEMQGLMEDGDYNIKSHKYHADIIKTELTRLMIKAKGATAEDEVRTLANDLYSLFRQNAKMHNFLQMLYVCDFISRHINKN